MEITGNNVLILPDKLPESTKSNIVIPATSKSMAKDEGIVVQTGPECEEVRKGNRVIFQKQGMSIMEIEGVVHYIGNESQIKYIYE